MLYKIKKVLAIFSIASLVTIPILIPVAVNAQATTTPSISGGLNCGSSLTVQPGCEATPNTNAPTTVNNTIALVINIISLVVGVIAVIMIIIGGLKYITSGGDSGNITGAKNTILYAIIGLIIVALAQIIVRFVLAKVTSVTTTGP